MPTKTSNAGSNTRSPTVNSGATGVHREILFNDKNKILF